MKSFNFLFLLFLLAAPIQAQTPTLSEGRIRDILPAFEVYVEKARVDWNVPSVAVAVVYNDEILWWKGMGESPPDQETVFAIGSTTKAFAAATLAMMVDGGGSGWDARVVDHFGEFAMKDPWVTREMRVRDLLAQHSGMAPQALSAMGTLGYSRERIRNAMRWVEPVTSFRSHYAYVNSPHIVAGQMVADWAGTAHWEDVLNSRLLQPLRMTNTTWDPAGLDNNPNRADGHATVNGKVKKIATGPFPYSFGPAGALNSNLHDMAHWVRMQLGNGEFEGRRLVSKENLLVTRTPQTVIGENAFYCMGWLKLLMNGYNVTWHNGGTPGHTTFVGLQPEEGLGIIVLSNLGGTTMPDAVGLHFFDLVNGVDGPDYSAQSLARRESPVLKPILNLQVPQEMYGAYEHPALGRLEVTPGPVLTFQETGVKASLEPVGPNLFRIRYTSGWLNDIGWDNGGEAFYAPEGLSQPAGLTLFLGEPGQGASFTAEKTDIPQSIRPASH